MTYLAISIGAVLGADLRFLVGGWIAERWGSSFPLATLVINASGSFLLGIVLMLVTDRVVAPGWVRPLVAIGFPGSYTTFSTFSYETLALARDGASLAAGANVTRGIAGFGANSRIRTSTILRLSLDLPVVLTWVDAPERVERLLAGLRARSGSGIITVEEVEIAGYGGRRLEQLRFDLQVQDVMRRDVASVSRDALVGDAVAALIGREFRALPVVDADGRLVGIVANSDLVQKGGLPVRLELLSAMPEDARRETLEDLPTRTVREVMRTEPTTLRPGESLDVATRRMSDQRLKRLPVVDDHGRLVGVLSRADVLRAVAESFPREPADRTFHSGARTAGELMRSDAPVVHVDAPLDSVVDAVASTRLDRAVVVDDVGRVVGVVTDAQVLASVEPSARPGVAGALMRVGRAAGGRARAGDLMRPDPPTVPATASLAEAARAMVTHGRKILPVVDAEGRLLGILDRTDLLHAASDALAEIGQANVEGEEEQVRARCTAQRTRARLRDHDDPVRTGRPSP